VAAVITVGHAQSVEDFAGAAAGVLVDVALVDVAPLAGVEAFSVLSEVFSEVELGVAGVSLLVLFSDSSAFFRDSEG
jgi:hypothetical protein